MKKNIFKTSFLLFAILASTANAQSFKKKQLDINLGVGLGNTIVSAGSTKIIPPISTSVEYGITDDISIGGYLGFSGASYSYLGTEWCNNGNGGGFGYGNYYNYKDTYTWTYFILGARGSYHFGRFIKIDKLDVYAGLMLGNDFAHYKYSTTSVCTDHTRYSSPAYGGFAFSVYGGARYRFTDHFGVFSELGYGVTYLNLGVNFKF